MSWMLAIGALLAGLGAGAAIYIIARLTYSIIQRFRKKAHTDVIAVSMDRITENIRRDPRVTRKKLSQLNDYDAVVAECDPYTGSIVQTSLCRDVGAEVHSDLVMGGGYAVYED